MKLKTADNLQKKLPVPITKFIPLTLHLLPTEVKLIYESLCVVFLTKVQLSDGLVNINHCVDDLLV